MSTGLTLLDASTLAAAETTLMSADERLKSALSDGLNLQALPASEVEIILEASRTLFGFPRVVW